MANEVLKKFGKFFLLDRIAQGGMAEIYRARLASEGGASRILVIKRIQAGFGTNKEFQEMFKSEIQVTMGFNHPNIVQVYDFGEELGQPFIAMEFVDGRNLRQLITESRAREQKIPIDLAAFMLEQACSGLHYAHSYKDKVTGQPYNIIHRDISPQNIIVSYDGVIKVIDFGIAKANVERENTRAGVIKGKPSYLSPEQVVGEVLDARSDIFSLGIVLWELLTGIKLFKAKSNDNEFVVLKMIESCSSYVVPPSRHNPDVPTELDDIVMKSLSKDKAQRFQSAEDFRKSLRKFLAVYSPHVGNSEISIFMKRLFQNIIVNDRKNLQELNQKAERLLQDITHIPPQGSAVKDSKSESIPTSVKSSTPDKKVDETMTFKGFSEKEKQFENSSLIKNKESLKKENVIEAEKKKLQPAIKVNLNVEAPSPYARNRTYHSHNPSMKYKSAQKPLNLLPLFKFGFMTFSGVFLLGMIFGPGFFGIESKTLEGLRTQLISKVLTLKKEHLAQDDTEQTPPVEGADDKQNGEIRIRYNIYPEWGKKAVVFINGKQLNVEGGVFIAPFNTPYHIKVQKPGFKDYEKNEYYSSATYSTVSEHEANILLELEVHGYLSIKTFPNADITITPIDRSIAEVYKGEKSIQWVHSSPVEQLQLPVGMYRVKMQNDILNLEKDMIIKIEEDRENIQNVSLEKRK